jgi:Protein of unknown function (DUF3048) N-terminal domain/Protein of unknown function (DUF3048) C-terminal domain
MKRSTKTFAVTLVLVATVTACSGSDAAPATTTTEPPTTTAAPTTVVETTVAATTSVEEPTTTAAPAAAVFPLTGLPSNDDPKALRPALVVKIDNNPQARPQTGLNEADIVYEENVEQITRFAAVFQSNDADPVGPIRSGRTQDIALLSSLNHPLFAWSGGNGNVTQAIRASDLIDISVGVVGDDGGYFRDRSRNVDVEHTLYATTPALFSLTPLFAPPPPAQFQYRADGVAVAGEPALGAEIAMDGVKVTWVWDSAVGAYMRSQGNRPHDLVGGGQVNAPNVVVLEVDYQPSPADVRSPEAQTVGTGAAIVFTAGNVIRGTWTRNDKLQPFSLVDDSGAPIVLTPGRTWVELSKVGKINVLPPI